MTDAPELIWAEPDGGDILVHNGDPALERLIATGYLYEYRRADLCADPALLAEAVEVLRFYADPTFNGYDVTVGDYGLSMETGKIIKDSGNRARAFIAKLENRHDR